MHKTPAKCRAKLKRKGTRMPAVFEILMSLDTIGPVSPPDVRANRFILSARDKGTRYGALSLQKTKIAGETALSFQALFHPAEKIQEVRAKEQDNSVTL